MLQYVISFVIWLLSLLFPLTAHAETAHVVSQVTPPLAAKTLVTRETLQEKALQIAKEYGVSSTTLFNLVESESRWNPNAEGDGGKSCGLGQFYIPSHPDFTCEEAKDPDFALRAIASELAVGREWQWSVCSCVKTLRNRIGNVPKQNASDFVPNASLHSAEALILDYNGVRHVASKEEVTNEGILVFEGNFKPCKTGYRLVQWSEVNSRLVGFWKSET